MTPDLTPHQALSKVRLTALDPCPMLSPVSAPICGPRWEPFRTPRDALLAGAAFKS